MGPSIGHSHSLHLGTGRNGDNLNSDKRDKNKTATVLSKIGQNGELLIQDAKC